MIHGGPGGHILRDINYHIGQATYHSNISTVTSQARGKSAATYPGVYTYMFRILRSQQGHYPLLKLVVHI
jgi:hypothetical protein